MADKNLTKKIFTNEYQGSILKQNIPEDFRKGGLSDADLKKDSFMYRHYMDDGGESLKSYIGGYTPEKVLNINSGIYKNLLHSHNLFEENEIDDFHKTYRFGKFNRSQSLSTTKEFLFFTKPDLYIYTRSDNTGMLKSVNGKPVLNGILNTKPYWIELSQLRPDIIETLQLSVNPLDNFNHLLQNRCISNLEIPSLSASLVDTATNMYGVGYSYRGSSEASDDNIDFSLEFKDTKYLETYYFFKSYENYETLKHHGVIRPWIGHIENRVIHDQFSIYKFLVAEDMETIVYYCKYFGVMPKSLPRDTFSTSNFENGLSYSIEFKAAFFEDMSPEIIYDFNAISYQYYVSRRYQIDIYNTMFDRVDNRPAKAAYVIKDKDHHSPNGYVFKLKWRGDDKV